MLPNAILRCINITMALQRVLSLIEEQVKWLYSECRARELIKEQSPLVILEFIGLIA